MKTKVTEYKGLIAIEGSLEADGLMNDPQTQLGFVVDAAYVEMSTEARAALSLVARSGDDVGEVDAFRVSDGRVAFAWLGGSRRLIDPSSHTGSNSYDPTLLDGVVTIIPNDPPKAFVEGVDAHLHEGEEEDGPSDQDLEDADAGEEENGPSDQDLDDADIEKQEAAHRGES